MAGVMTKNKIGFILCLFFLLTTYSTLIAGESELGTIVLSEDNGLDRHLEYVEFSIQIPVIDNESSFSLTAVDNKTSEIIPAR